MRERKYWGAPSQESVDRLCASIRRANEQAAMESKLQARAATQQQPETIDGGCQLFVLPSKGGARR
jgi:hypothetical protein